ncbi:hypothetical protein N7462_008522 [Penicillium macrosclerotiorum]|uniref:uncharacterized protein n=1 Tax=Penicillium macrosclerotiorum TaxID=303699 RepID=UPI0025496E0C|nr:uncharacterized protein N7462_008522 [Penicillium macrosclerotiorum]KAJ5675625.1 hypothetical protein N7462_008522 [Penicillium macrosclerotiorum]
MTIQQQSNPSGQPDSDLAELWQTAVKSYEETTGKSLRLGSSNTMDDVMQATEGLSTKFKDFRDDKSKVSKVRTAFKNNMWLIKDIVGAVQQVGNAASAFPPAMPASLIFSVFGHVMQSFSDVSADYDKVMGFFDFTHRFFDRLSIIDHKMPNSSPFQRCVLRVFSSILKLCAIAQKYCAEKRFKKWFESLLKGSDGALAGASKEMEEAINELSQAVGLTTLKTVEVLDEVVQSMNGNVEFLVANANLIDERTKAIQLDTATIIKQNEELESKQDEMTDMQRETLDKMTEQSRMLTQVVGYFGSIQMGENFGKAFQTSLLKLSVVRLRLTRWGESIGLVSMTDITSLHQAKISPEDIPQVEDLLNGILDQFADAERISQRFQRRNTSVQVLDPAKELDEVSASLHQTMSDIVKKRQGDSEPDPTTNLTLYEEKNFTRLIEDVSDLVNDLVNLFPGIQEDQRKLCEQEVSEMKKIKNALPLLKDVAADDDKMLSETVVKVIKSTTTTTYNNSVVFSGTNSGFQVGNNKGNISNVRFN